LLAGRICANRLGEKRRQTLSMLVDALLESIIAICRGIRPGRRQIDPAPFRD
jgi:hypothetical protein